MEEQKSKKKALPIVVMICITVMVIAIGSYALWQMTKKQSGRNVVGTACLSIDIEDESGDISLQNQYPISDADGANTNPYTFTVTNNCDQAVNYIVALESLPATNNESSSYLDYDYIRLQLDNDSPLTYGSLEGITNDNGVRDTKEITHHTLGAGESVTHNLRIWVKEDTPLQNEDESYNTEKFFYGKVKVLAGQGIEGNQESLASGLKLLSDPNEPDVTLSNIQVGDLVGYQTEQFYIIGIDDNNIKLLSRYLINVGDHQNQNVTSGLQSAELVWTRPSLTSGPVEYREESEERYYYGGVPFSGDSYWWDNDNNDLVSPYSQNSFVYNDQSSISNYINGYVNTLTTMGLNVTNGTLLSLEELSTLCNTTITTSGNYSSQCPNYIFETTYWLGNVYDVYGVWRVRANGDVYSDSYYNGDYGVRPVITVNLGGSNNSSVGNALTYPLSGALDNGATYLLTSDNKLTLGGKSSFTDDDEIKTEIAYDVLSSNYNLEGDLLEMLADFFIDLYRGKGSYNSLYEDLSEEMTDEEALEEFGVSKSDILSNIGLLQNIVGVNTVEFTDDVTYISSSKYILGFVHATKAIVSSAANVSFSDGNITIERR